MTDEDVERDYQQPTPWYRTEAGETVIAVACVVVTIAMGYLIRFLPGPQILIDAVAVVALCAMLAGVLFSGRAATKAVGRAFESD